ncbi:tyrosine-type recombinase/integrase [Pseudomonas sp. CT11-2]|uniref:Integrase n=1 Tax=Pseudomonas umsongensis TaxID=198618 RepID=A0ACC5M8X8_9PSED|nr:MULTISPECIES: tyrosine-type recombinase/integrase [Pseudomonas]MBB2885060.1 integrase [Pseudomonas umsongensis]NMN74704.1 Site-specific recombinase XerD [Pseudomonas sp. KD5]
MIKRRVEYPESAQLFTLIPKLRLYDYISLDRLHTLDGSNMPFMTWPNGMPCLQANAYMIKTRMKPGRGGNGPSRAGTKGGTFGEYAGKISHLIRFCYYNNLSFIALSDDDFCEFIDGLRREMKRNQPNQRKRTERTIVGIGRRCLSFLAYVGEMSGLHNFVGIDGTISIYMVDSVYYRNGKAFTRSSVHHRSFRTPEAKKTRQPIGEATIEKLRNAIDEMSTSEFLNNRRHLMISLFEELGARRGEIQPITVAEVLAAAKVKQPTISVTTLKRGGMGLTRALELSPPMIDELMNYIRGDRFIIMKRFKGVPDHGFLFVTERGGRPLGIDTFTTEFSLIRRAAGVEEQACAHLFRHAYCTNIVARLIAETQALSPDSFRQTLMTNKMLAERALTKSGHATLESLLGYVDTAFKTKSKYEQIIHNVEVAKIYETYQKRRKRLLDDFAKEKISKEIYIEREQSLTESMERLLKVA